MATDTYGHSGDVGKTAVGDYVFVGSSTTINVKCRGAGGYGAPGQGGFGYGSSGGGGGAYAATPSQSISIGVNYTVTVGDGAVASIQRDSKFDTLVIAKGGGNGITSSGTDVNGGTGATAAASTGTTKFSGGNGGQYTVAAGTGTGGGGGAGDAGNGGSVASAATTGGTGGTAGGGAGGTGANFGGTGLPGSGPGGGGAGDGNFAGSGGHEGGIGQVILVYTPVASARGIIYDRLVRLNAVQRSILRMVGRPISMPQVFALLDKWGIHNIVTDWPRFGELTRRDHARLAKLFVAEFEPVLNPDFTPVFF